MKEVPPRSPKPEKGGFVSYRVQRMPASIAQGDNPVYRKQEQINKYAPGHKLAKDGSKDDDGVFDHYLIPREAHDAIQAGCAREANERLKRRDLNLTSYTGVGRTEPIDEVTETVQTLGQVGNSLPSATEE